MKTIGSLKVSEKTLENMKSSIERYNSKNIFPVTQSEFRRMAIELLSQLILQNKPIPIKVTG